MDRIELLSPQLLEEDRTRINHFWRISSTLNIGMGWHYLLDLSWITKQISGNPHLILDAGAGIGIIQWYLAEKGYDIISVDLRSRRHLSGRFRKSYKVEGYRRKDLSYLTLGFPKTFFD